MGEVFKPITAKNKMTEYNFWQFAGWPHQKYFGGPKLASAHPAVIFLEYLVFYLQIKLCALWSPSHFSGEPLWIYSDELRDFWLITLLILLNSAQEMEYRPAWPPATTKCWLSLPPNAHCTCWCGFGFFEYAVLRTMMIRQLIDHICILRILLVLLIWFSLCLYILFLSVDEAGYSNTWSFLQHFFMLTFRNFFT